MVILMNIRNKKISTRANTVTPNKIKSFMTCLFVILILLLVRLAFLQFVQGADLKEKAFKQQTVSKLINPKRGNILDATRKKFSY